MHRLESVRVSKPVLATAALCLLAAVLPPRAAAADDALATDPVSDGTGGPSTFTPPATVSPDGAREALTPHAQVTVDPSTGFAIASFAFQLPRARGGAQPALALSYNSSSATVPGHAGLGWTLSASSITRRGAAGMPRFTDDVFTAGSAALSDPGATFDEYLVDGQILVPICAVGSCTASQLVPGELLPAQLAGTALTGWMYFRREVDDGARYFFAPGGQTWLRQEKSGTVTQYGHPLDAGQVDPSFGDGIERPASGTNFATPVQAATAAYRWCIVRQADAVGNTVYYAWTDNAALAPASTLPGTLYLSDVYDTLGVGLAPAPGAFAHHAHLAWQVAQPIKGPITTPIWRARPLAQLSTVDVTSASWSSLARALVRRYSLSYVSNQWGTRNRLAAISLEGECVGASGALSPVPENDGVVPNPSGCANPSVLKLAQYAYSPDAHGVNDVAPYPADTAWSIPGQFVLGGNLHQQAAFVDVTGDGAADFLVPDPAGSSFDYLPFSGQSVSQLADGSGGALVGAYSLQDTRNAPVYPLIFGDWLSNGMVNWLVNAPPWSVYTPSGGAFVGGPMGVGSCQTSGTCYSGRSWDVDGDGLTDSTFQAGGHQADSSTYLTQRTHGGAIAPFGLATPTFMSWDNAAGDLTAYANGQPFWRSIADVDGDGLADSVFAVVQDQAFSPVKFVIWLNHGDGDYGSPNPGAAPGGVESQAWVVAGFPLPVERSASLRTDTGVSMIRMADLNLDGLVDLVKLSADVLIVCLQYSRSSSKVGAA